MLHGARIRTEMKLFGPEHRRDFGKGQKLALVGTELSVATLIGLYGGHWVDSKLGSRPIGTLIGLALGIAAGFKGLFQLVQSERARVKRTEERERRAAEKELSNADKKPASPTSPP